MKTQQFALAKKYARAFTNVYSDIIHQEEINALHELLIFIKKHADALFYAQLSPIENSTVKQAFAHLLKRYHVTGHLEKLIDLLLAQKRLFLLPDIIHVIIVIIKERLSIVEFTLESSHELTVEELKALQDFLTSKTKKNIIYTTKINKHLIAGIKLYSDTLGFEYSIRQQLEALRNIQ